MGGGWSGGVLGTGRKNAGRGGTGWDGGHREEDGLGWFFLVAMSRFWVGSGLVQGGGCGI